MRVTIALHVPTGQYFTSNSFTGNTQVVAWIAAQEVPKDFIPVSVDLPNAQWTVVKSKLDHITHNATMAHNLQQVRVSTLAPVEAPKPPVHTPAPVYHISPAEIASILQEAEGLQVVIGTLRTNLELWQKAHDNPQAEGAIRAVKQELNMALRRLAFLEAQTDGVTGKDVATEKVEPKTKTAAPAPIPAPAPVPVEPVKVVEPPVIPTAAEAMKAKLAAKQDKQAK